MVEVVDHVMTKDEQRQFENDIKATLVTVASQVAEGAGRAYIASDGYIYLSPRISTNPLSNSTITVTYIVENAQGARDIDFCDIEYGAVGTMLITYDFSKKYKGF